MICDAVRKVAPGVPFTSHNAAFRVLIYGTEAFRLDVCGVHLPWAVQDAAAHRLPLNLLDRPVIVDLINERGETEYVPATIDRTESRMTPPIGHPLRRERP